MHVHQSMCLDRWQIGQALTGRGNPYPEKLGVIAAGAYADILIVDGNPHERTLLRSAP